LPLATCHSPLQQDGFRFAPVLFHAYRAIQRSQAKAIPIADEIAQSILQPFLQSGPQNQSLSILSRFHLTIRDAKRRFPAIMHAAVDKRIITAYRRHFLIDDK
jgi:hypothetical protein